MTSDSQQNDLNTCNALIKETELSLKDHPGDIKLLNKLFSCYLRSGTLYQIKGERDLALEAFNSSVILIEKLLKTDPENTKWPLDACLAYEMTGNVFLDNKDLKNAEHWFLKAILLCKNFLGEEHPTCIARINNLNFLFKKNKAVNTLNQLYGNMKNAMTGNPALTKIDHMLLEAEKYQPGQSGINEKVNFAVSFPACLAYSENYVLDVWLFTEEQRNKLLLRIKEENEEKINIKSQGPVIIERGTAIIAMLQIDKLVVEPQEKSLLWTGELTNTSFLVKVPEFVKESFVTGRVSFYLNGLEISRFYFKITLTARQEEGVKAVGGLGMSDKYRIAFASYASEDRNDVLARVQGLEKAGVEVYMDVRNLRSGDNYEEKLMEKINSADVFYLFWSSAAKKSEWVKKEWEYALQNRGINFISPIPLESPDTVPPPSELGRVLHFNDWTLAYKRSMAVN